MVPAKFGAVNILPPTLDTLQRRTYEKIRSNVYRIIGRWLSAELTAEIFQFALTAEEIPAGPRIIIPAVHKDDKEIT
ncbi:hypothetical protein BU25DRAFT_413784 [Macroventuria anomochaeta]|uniref:Uncharacterized protein n=1 Tax=Macroventuria anomochaeta TaxID=301207 RepID=A0ACB6RQQ4_9PLEO|nr:uncharacterized protein BU25DRAFT_413784 [Macroventuria anomochaeta]KAF2624226.1 hypothetical protein BU25DRAFT_413784 [Macroventuria anomochaeta]